MISLDCAEPSVYHIVLWDVMLKEICLNVSFFLTFLSFCSLKIVTFSTDNPDLVVVLVVVF